MFYAIFHYSLLVYLLGCLCLHWSLTEVTTRV